MDKKYIIEAFLREFHKGEERAIHSRELEALFSLSGRALRKLVSELRKDEVPICSSKDGYFYAKTQAEISKCARMLGRLSDGVNSSRVSLLSSRVPNMLGGYVIIIIDGGMI